MTDAHNHLWIKPVRGASSDSPALSDRQAVLAELKDYRLTGGSAILDCQPGGCGRDGRVLAGLSRSSGVHVVACTGFHRRRYYSSGFWLWKASAQEGALFFISEIHGGLVETRSQKRPVKAGFIKVACEAALDDTPLAALKGAAEAAIKTGFALEVHTEKGSAAEAILDFLVRSGTPLGQLILCHMDKRPDFGLHRELASAGVLLEYDTFYRPKYEPEKNLWKLIERMVASGLGDRVALATDMAEASMWSRLGGGPGLTGFPLVIRPRLQASGLEAVTIAGLMGGNITRRLARCV
jgi:phosphotriesterase-related protein